MAKVKSRWREDGVRVPAEMPELVRWLDDLHR
jgi:hypothetical protein